MRKVEVTINGNKYPCRPTMGAMLRFKRETGKEVTELKDSNISELCVYLSCCVQSACAADKKPFDMELMEFADALNPEDLTAWMQQVQGPAATSGGPEGENEKKRAGRKA